MILAFAALGSLLFVGALYVVQLTPVPHGYVPVMAAILFAVALVAGLQTVRHRDEV